MGDYRQMWEQLGMDLDRHDLLCSALPDVFREVFLSQNLRPESMDYYDFVVAEIHGVRPMELLEHKERGGKVFGTFCVYVPEEVIFAAGAIATGLCGGSQFWVPVGEKVLPANTCPLIKASVGARLDRTCPFFRLADVYIGETTCDGKKKAWEILAEDVPIHVMNVPNMKRPQDVGAFKEEIVRLIEVVEGVTGSKITPDSLKQAIRLINEKRRALKRLYELRKASPSPISGKDALLVTQIALYDDPSRFTEMTNKLCNELEQRIKDRVGVVQDNALRIVVTGTPMAIPNWKVHALVESLGAVVVAEELCTGTRYFEHLVDEEADDLNGYIANLAERCMKTNCACFTPNKARIQDIIRLVSEYKADAVIDISLQFCTLYDTESYLVGKGLKEAGIPVTHLVTDYSDQDTESLRTRIEAFLEMVRVRER